MMAATPDARRARAKNNSSKDAEGEYHTGAFVKRMLSPLDAITVTLDHFLFST